MPIPVINYAAIPPQGNPGAKAMLPSLMQGMQAGIAPFQAYQDMQKQKLANELARIQAQYSPQQNQAELALQQQRLPMMQAQTDLANQQAQYYGPNMQSEMGLRGAQTNLTNEQAKYLPLDTLISASNSQRGSTRFGQAYQLSKMLSSMAPAARDSWIAQNQGAYTDMVNTMANKASQEQEGNQNDMLAGAIAQTFPQFQGQKLPQSQQQQQMLQHQPIAQQGFQTTPEQIQALAQASNLEANKSVTTAKTRNQLEGAIQVGQVMNSPEFQSKAQNAASYAGALGRGKAVAAKLFQQNPAAYEDYLSFRNHDMVLLQNRIKTLDQMGATDAQRAELNGLYDKTMDSFTSNPEQFITQLNKLGVSLDTVQKAVQKSAMPLGGPNRIESFKPIQQKNTTATVPPQYQSFVDAAKNRGVSDAQIQQRLAELEKGGK